MTKRIIYITLSVLLLTDLSFSFFQHLNQPLDGDMSWNLIPADDVKPVLEKPFGIKAIINNETYINPNRFFCHWSFRAYLLNAPIFLQNFVKPIDSVYLACAIAKIIILILLIFILASTISGSQKIYKIDFMTAAILVTPLFQTNGYRSYMGIIDPSTTYTFFYALPLLLIILYLLPFINKYYIGKEVNNKLIIKLLWIPFAFIVCLSGPLNPGIALIFTMCVLLSHFIKSSRDSKHKSLTKKVRYSISSIPKEYWFYLLPISLLSLYSLFLGRYNSITISTQIPLKEMYLELPKGLFYQFTSKLGFPVLFLILAINAMLIRLKFYTHEGRKILHIFKWIGIFSLCYMVLLPLGGYRDYRPYILRYDTIMPITISLIFMFGTSTLFLIKRISGKQKLWYLPIVISVLLIYTNSDEAEFYNNDCERDALEKIANSDKYVVALDNNCSVLDWRKNNDPKASKLHGKLLKFWGITKEEKLYYHK